MRQSGIRALVLPTSAETGRERAAHRSGRPVVVASVLPMVQLQPEVAPQLGQA